MRTHEDSGTLDADLERLRDRPVKLWRLAFRCRSHAIFGLPFGGRIAEEIDRFKRRALHAGITLDRRLELASIIDIEREAIAQARDCHQERLLVGQITLATVHDSNAAIGGQHLRHMGIERIGEIETAEHRVALLQPVLCAQGCLHHDSLFVDSDNPGLVGIEQASLVIGLGPPDVQGGDKTSHWNASEVLSVAE